MYPAMMFVVLASSTQLPLDGTDYIYPVDSCFQTQKLCTLERAQI